MKRKPQIKTTTENEDTNTFNTRYQKLRSKKEPTTLQKKKEKENHHQVTREYGEWPNIILADIGYEFVPLTIYPQFEQLPKSYRYRSPHMEI
jgi:hypothetical protein